MTERRRRITSKTSVLSLFRRPSMIALALAHLAAEDPIDEYDVAENDRQQDQRPGQHEELARGCGGGLPERQRWRHEIGKGRDHEAEIAEQEQHDRCEKGEYLAALLERAPGHQRSQRRKQRYR